MLSRVASLAFQNPLLARYPDKLRDKFYLETLLPDAEYIIRCIPPSRFATFLLFVQTPQSFQPLAWYRDISQVRFLTEFRYFQKYFIQ